jgi:predicted amidophosphoribosyltransferase
VPCLRLLERRGPDAAQTGRSRRDRLRGPRFVGHPRARGRRVVLVDDVVTTGATLRAATLALRRAGARSVVPAAVAATPAALRPADMVA